MKKRIMLLAALVLLLGALCLSAGAIQQERPYKEGKTIKIIDHVVYQYRSFPNQPKHYAVIDYFDTDKAANDWNTKTIKIRSKIGKIPVTEIDVDVWNDLGTSSGRCESRFVRKIVLPQSITKLNTFAFSGFSSLRSITLPDSISVIPDYTFDGCASLREVVLNSDVTRVENGAFRNCRSLRTFPFSDKLEYVGWNAFCGAGFRKLALPATATYEDCAFASCGDLLKVNLQGGDPNAIFELQTGLFKDCDELVAIALPKESMGIWISNVVFENCYNLKTIKNVTKIRRIDSAAFDHCWGLEAFAIPKNIEYVHPYAFLACVNLKTLCLNSKNPNLLKDSLAFYRYEFLHDGNFIDFLRNDCMIYVPTVAMKRMVQEEALHGKVAVRVSVAAPQNLTAEPKTVSVSDRQTDVILRWKAVPQADGYEIASNIFGGEPAKTQDTQFVLHDRSPLFDATYGVRAYRVIDGDVSYSAYSVVPSVGT